MPIRAAAFVWACLVGAACDWVTFDAGDERDGDGDAAVAEPDTDVDASVTAGEDAGPDPCADVTCPDDRVCSAGDCVDPRLDEDRDGFGASSDCDDRDRDVVPGSTRPCDASCGEGVETCAQGRWGECSAPTECDCAPGDTRLESCGRCGEATRTCGRDGWGPAGACEGEGACAAGATEIRDCDAGGLCGLQSRACGEGCAWGAWSSCESISECAPGATESRACGVCGTQDRACTAGCLWGAFADCAEVRDSDGDGHDALACQGDDCDDGNAAVSPSRVEREAWSPVEVDLDGESAIGSRAHLAGDGTAHVCASSAGQVAYATDRGGAWQSDFLDEDSSSCEVVVDSEGTAHLIFATALGASGDTRHAWGEPGAWQTETVFTTGYGVLAAAGLDGDVHMAFRGQFDLWYAGLVDDRWDSFSLTGYPDRLKGLVVDGDGEPYVAYETSDQEADIFVARRAGGHWSHEYVETGSANVRGLGLDGTGAALLAAQSSDYNQISVLREDRLGWIWDDWFELDDGVLYGWAFDERGVSHIVTVRLDQPLRVDYWTDETGAWASSTVADVTASSASIAAGPTGVVVSYLVGGHLWVAHRDRPNGADDDCDGAIW